MADANVVFEEVKLQARMKYLAFKRSVIIMEAVLLIMSFIALSTFEVPNPWFAMLLIVQAAKLVGEHWNHNYLARVFNTPDRWTWLPIMVFTGSG